MARWGASAPLASCLSAPSPSLPSTPSPTHHVRHTALLAACSWVVGKVAKVTRPALRAPKPFEPLACKHTAREVPQACSMLAMSEIPTHLVGGALRAGARACASSSHACPHPSLCASCTPLWCRNTQWQHAPRACPHLPAPALPTSLHASLPARPAPPFNPPHPTPPRAPQLLHMISLIAPTDLPQCVSYGAPGACPAVLPAALASDPATWPPPPAIASLAAAAGEGMEQPGA